MKKSILSMAIITIIVATFSNANAQMNSKSGNTVLVGEEAMYPMKNIIENAVKSKDHTTLVAAVKAAGLVETLEGKGPFTVLAPVNNAFEDLPSGTVENLLKPENKPTLTSVLTYHVLAGKYSFDDIASAIKKGGGKSTMKTVQGQELTFMMNGAHNITVKDAAGNVADFSTYDVNQSNGVIHVIDRVLMPKI
jgi:uncharacterized surface protein with fasciclin (FAS1) repeats